MHPKRAEQTLESPVPEKPLIRQSDLAPRNRFDRMEWAGAFGDFGTLIPFVVGYIGVLKMDPYGVLLAFGIAMVVCGAYYKTPFPVQPMKAIGAVAITQAAQTAVITPAAVYGASLATGLLWLVLGLTGAASRIAKLVSRPVIVGIILGLGMSFMLEGVKMMATHWVIAAVGLAGTLLLLINRRVPAMFLLLLFGAICGMILNPDAVQALTAASVEVRAPRFVLLELTWNDLLIGLVFLALPQLPLTLGNAVIAIRDENNRLFPDRPVTDKGVATSTGLMNIAGAAVGGVPMCHGAGGMAGHVAFGARTGGALIIVGTLLLVLAVFFSGSIDALFRLFPAAILGVILFLTGAQLALGSCEFSKDKGERFVTLVTAAFAMWNIGVAFLVGIAGCYLVKRGWLRL
ncbi:MAG: putative sulfate/molybdate transporter [Sulfuricaulis sp.]|uniref:putative sulfate/molybdate transporter n=1 Tax=Sulfuricaulis sp. TaxID=2003553 RepID=UPI0034A48C38